MEGAFVGHVGSSLRSSVRPADARRSVCGRSSAAGRGARGLQMKGVDFPSPLDGSPFRIGIVSTRWSAEMVEPMRKTVIDELKAIGVKDESVVEMSVPGCWELPVAARYMTQTQKVDAVIAIGILIQGETSHYQYISQSVASGLMGLQVNSGIPVILGVLTCLTTEQAVARSTGDKAHSAAWAKTAVEMAMLRASQMGNTKTTRKSVGFS